jgi:hypothetical protein
MPILETYLAALRDIRSSGEAVDETSYYVPLANLFNELGKSLKPKVHCVLTLKNRGAGIPDGGLFTDEQIKKSKADAKPLPQNPARGVIEVKPTSDDAWITADGPQVTRYWGKYGQVLVTNYRDFVLLGKDPAGHPVKLETYRLAENENDFWKAAAAPKKTAAIHEATFVEFAKRTMLHAAPVAAPEDLAWFLASYARDALHRISLHELPALANVRKALEEALGLTFEGEKGEHFFRSTLVQTLFYGVFSAWVLWSKQQPPRRDALVAPPFRAASSPGSANLPIGGFSAPPLFDWTQTSRLLRVPVLRKLFHEVAEPGQLDKLNLSEILDWTAAVLNRVDRPAFFSKFQEAHAVQYFYEPFLQAFDPELRKQLGVWYTPPEIVQYMVARVDTVLREELGLADGLADKNVYVLDPCCGTGSFLVEVLKLIHKTLKDRGDDALIAADLKEAAKNRIFGFEILPAPFVVAHLQIGLLLQNFGAPLAEKGSDRVGVYLTNALTGWEPPNEPKKRLLFPELQEERDAAEHVKRATPILVVLGNPPYNGFAGVSPEEEQGLVEPYKEGLVKEWKIKKFNLDDLYIRFFRLAERRIAEMSGRGVVSYISNHSWVSDPSFVVLRKHLLHSFDRFWIENMHGNRKISEYAPDGRTSETIFAIPGFSAGIQQGVAVSLWVKSGKPSTEDRILFREDLTDARAVDRRANLLESLVDPDRGDHYVAARPSPGNRFSFRPQKVTRKYMSWPSVDSLCKASPTLGILENRQESLIDIDKKTLDARMRLYFDPKKSWDEVSDPNIGIYRNFARFDAQRTREKILRLSVFDEKNIRPFLIRPMDVRWCYYSGIRPLWNEPRPAYIAQLWPGNTTIVTRRRGVSDPEGVPFFITTSVGFQHALNTDAYYIPVELRSFENPRKKQRAGQMDLLQKTASKQPASSPNLSTEAETYLKSIGAAHDQKLWMHCLAIGHAPAFLFENRDGIRQNWPHVPLPNSADGLDASAGLGRKVADLLETSAPLLGVTSGVLRPEVTLIAISSRAGGGNLNESDIALTAGWGRAGRGGVTMPGKGKLPDRNYSPTERKAMLEGGSALGLSEKKIFELLGEKTYDIYLNDVAYWSNIPEKVWDYTIGGYQVIKKWLSYREQPLLGRALTIDEVRYVQEMARRIAAILLLGPALDANYEAVKAHTFPWPPTP